MQSSFENFKPQINSALQTSRDAASLAISQFQRSTELALTFGLQTHAFARTQTDEFENLNDPSVVLQLLQDQLRAASTHAASVAKQAFELSHVFHEELSGFVESQFDVAHAEVNKLIGEALKSAPQGSEHVVESITQAVHVSNQAMHDARDAIKKASELAKQTFEQLHEHEPVTKKPTHRRT
jgi:hypothetical protein